MPSDPKKPEAPKPLEDVKAACVEHGKDFPAGGMPWDKGVNPKAAHLVAMANHGARLCAKCLGIGLARTKEGQPRTECKDCLGTGSVPCPAGELEVFIANPCEIDPHAMDKAKEVLKAGWQRFPAAKQVRPEQPLRCYHYRVIGNDLPLAVVTEAEISLAVRGMDNPAGALRLLVAKKLGA